MQEIAGITDRERTIARGLRLEYATIFYNSLEAIIAIVSGMIAGSIALVGFGVDSVIEVTSGAALIWRLRSDADESGRERAERMTLRIVGVCFLALAAYVGYEAAESLLRREAPERSVSGILLACASVVVMPILARAKRRVAAGIGSEAMRADAKQTELCTYLSIILLGGLALNAALGWWWADPVAGLLMAPIIVREGWTALQGKNCGCATCH